MAGPAGHLRAARFGAQGLGTARDERRESRRFPTAGWASQVADANWRAVWDDFRNWALNAA
jgi:hypothetical protein